MEPKIIEIPGIPAKLQEQTLDQYVSVLSPDHLVRKQLDEIRNHALRSVELSTQLMQANDKILELQARLMKPAPELHAPVNTYKPAPDLTPQQEAVAVSLMTAQGVSPLADARSGPFPKAECPHCKKLVSTAPGPWASHQRNQHPDNPSPRPT